MGNKPFLGHYGLYAIIVFFAICWTLLAFHPYSVFDWWLENLLTLASLAGLAASYRWFRFSNSSYFLIMIFIVMHTIGAHFAYNTTPIDRFLNLLFHFERQNYDRVVHFAFGLLIAYPVYEVIVRLTSMRRGWAHIAVPWLILGFGAYYELIEMWVALIVSPEKGAMFLGSQGDPWDAQHDMEVALYGASIAMLAAFLFRRRR
ncbi:DUF2238 domain-containing protein [Paenibacillus sp. R14(2021)]|uniref:DUF2238 domain-containing protein n=1 Tax=Paenibacillus sp. R14(2021) TaxID=2859228 RepID=UPI001C612E51|nr:DUF2238 domain-containing protein [Paenibacillus sp. R14(2021)]